MNHISSNEAKSARAALTTALVMEMQDGGTQRQVFRTFMPEIYALREIKRLSYGQITAILNRHGFSLAESTVGSYYKLYLTDMKAELDAKLPATLFVQNELRKKTNGLAPSLIPEKVAELLENGGTS